MSDDIEETSDVQDILNSNISVSQVPNGGRDLHRSQHLEDDAVKATEHVANTTEEVIEWFVTNTGISALLVQMKRQRASARRSRMLSSQQRLARQQRNRSGTLD